MVLLLEVLMAAIKALHLVAVHILMALARCCLCELLLQLVLYLAVLLLKQRLLLCS